MRYAYARDYVAVARMIAAVFHDSFFFAGECNRFGIAVVNRRDARQPQG